MVDCLWLHLARYSPMLKIHDGAKCSNSPVQSVFGVSANLSLDYFSIILYLLTLSRGGPENWPSNRNFCAPYKIS